MFDRFETFSTTISFINKCVQKIKTNEMLPVGLKGSHVMCIYTLGKETDGLTASQLSKKCGEDKAAISRTLKELLDMKYIYPVSFTKKRVYRTKMLLTEKGKQVLSSIKEKINKALDFVGEGISESERIAFYNSLSIIASNLKTYVNQMEVDL